MKLIFTVIGFGEVGSTVAALINSNFENVDLNVLNTQTTKSGRIQDLEHAASCRNNSIFHNSKDKFEESDVIVYAAGFSNPHGVSRNSVALKNKELVYQIFSNVQLKKNALIISITNPVEPISQWIDKVTKGTCKVIGTGTALDTFRLKHILAEKLNLPKDEIDALVIGEHGAHMVPLYSQATISGKPLIHFCDQAMLASVTEELKNAAYQIRETEKATKYGISETCIELIRGFVLNKNFKCSFSVPSNYSADVLIENQIFISLPFQLNEGKLIPISLNSINEEEKKALNDAAISIHEVINLKGN
jgi:L-lactate dehydrogenase